MRRRLTKDHELRFAYSDDELGPAYAWRVMYRHFRSFDRYWVEGLLNARRSH